MKNKTVFGIIVLMLISISAIGLTYAYFLSTFITNLDEEDVVINAGSLELTYYDGNNTIRSKNIKPNTTVETKTFSVENTGDNIVTNYGVYLENIVNELKYSSDLQYTLTCKEYNKNKTFIKDCNGNSDSFPTLDNILVSNSIDVGYTHEYELVIKYLETNKNQSDDMNKQISGKIQIYDLNDIVDIQGTVSNYTEGDYITFSNNKIYKISNNGKYILPTIEPGYHTITINSSNGQDIWKASFEITKDKNEEIDTVNNIITINDESNIITINITKSNNENAILNIVSVG